MIRRSYIHQRGNWSLHDEGGDNYGNAYDEMTLVVIGGSYYGMAVICRQYITENAEGKTTKMNVDKF